MTTTRFIENIGKTYRYIKRHKDTLKNVIIHEVVWFPENLVTGTFILTVLTYLRSLKQLFGCKIALHPICSITFKSWDGRPGLWEGLGRTRPNLWGRHCQSIKPTSDWPSAQVLEVVWFVGKMLWIGDVVLGSIKKLVLNRYQGGQNHVSEAESAMAEYLQVPFALGLNSGGSAIFLALKLAGVSWYWWKENDDIKSNRCLVPGDSGHPCNDQLLHPHPCPWGNPPCWRSPSFRWILNNISVLLLFLLCSVECSEESFQLDLESLKEQQSATGARHLLLCYMRGKLPDMEGILQFCRCWSSYHLDWGWPSWFKVDKIPK